MDIFWNYTNMIITFAEICFAILQEMLQKVSELNARSLLSLTFI